MGIEVNDVNITLTGIIKEEDIKVLREKFNEIIPKTAEFDLTACDDIHTVVLQLIAGYSIEYGCSYTYDHESAFSKFLEGFSACENGSN